GQTTRFAFIDEGQRSLSKFERFLATHASLVRALPHAEIVYVARTQQHFEDAKRLFARRFSAQDRTHPACPSGVEHLLRWLTVNRKFHVERRSIIPAEHRLLQEGECIYRDPIHTGVIASWNNGTINAGKVRELFEENAAPVGFQTVLIGASYPRYLSFAAGHPVGHEGSKRCPQIALFPNEIAETAGHG
ncbi:MAG: hypothetical protein ACRD28_11885, partial [Acidobacteriaceae bacterium]